MGAGVAYTIAAMRPREEAASALPKPDRTLQAVGQQCLVRSMRQASRLLTALYDEALAPHGLKASQMTVLIAVGAMGVASPARIQDALDLEKSSLSRSAERLRASGLLASSPAAEGRGISYSLTAEGRECLERALPDWRKVQARVKRMLTASGVQALHGAVSALSGRSN